MTTAKQKPSTARVTKLREEGSEDRSTQPSGKHVGDMLREARENRGMTLDMVADELMIRRFYLEAMEAGSFSDLPERVYATGFVRSYATYVGADVPAFVEQFRRDAYGSRSSTYQVELVMPEPVVHSVIPSRTVILSAIVALALIIGGVVFATRSTNTAAPTTIPAPSETTAPVAIATPELSDVVTPPPSAVASTPATTVTSDPTATGFDLPAPPSVATPENSTTAVSAGLPASTTTAALPSASADAAAAPVVPTTRLAVEALESSWVEVKDSKGTVLFTSILKKGQLLPIPDQKGITLTTGNAGGLRIMVDGNALAPMGQTNEVKRNFALDADKLAQR